MNGKPTTYMIIKDFDLLKSPRSVRPLHSLHINIDCLLGYHEYNLKGDFEAIQHTNNFIVAKNKLYTDYVKDMAIDDIKMDLYTPTVKKPLDNIFCTLDLLDLTLGTQYDCQFKKALNVKPSKIVCHNLIKKLKGVQLC